MSEISTSDCFAKINETVGDMIKYVANEPSVGLYYIQQHAHSTTPNVIKLKNNIEDKSHEMILHIEDLEDSITMIKSMKECGPHTTDSMLREIRASLAALSARDGPRPRGSGYQMGRPGSWGPVTWARNAVEGDGGKGQGYLSGVIRAAKEKAGSLRWAPLDLDEDEGARGVVVRSGSDREGTESTLGGPHEDEGSKSRLSSEYDEFKADREAKLEEWLGG